MNKRFTIVNEHDEVMGYADDETGKIYRVTALWLTNSRGDILLAQRAFTKEHDPGIWGPAAAGTVEEGETYETNMPKEVEEELGLKNLPLTIGPKQRVTGPPYDYFVQWYLATIDKPAEKFVIQKEEVAQVRWFSRHQLATELHEHPEKYFERFSWALQNL